MSPDLLQPLQVFSQLVVQTVSEDLKSDDEDDLDPSKKPPKYRCDKSVAELPDASHCRALDQDINDRQSCSCAAHAGLRSVYKYLQL